MNTADKNNQNEDRKDLFNRLGSESITSEKESLPPDDEFFLRLQRSYIEARKMEWVRRIFDELLSAAYDCHGDGCCC